LETAARDGYALDERWHLRRDGSVFFASGAVSPVRGSEPREFVKIARDLTERKRMEEALRDADRRKNEFLATLSHELRNPLAPIRSGLDLLKRAGYDRRLIMRTLKVIERQTDQIVHLVDDLLDISRITRGKIRLKQELIELGPVVRQVLENAGPLMRERTHHFSSSLPREPVYLDADATRIEQVLFNVVSNAAKYTPPGGRITLEVRAEESEVVIAVKDNGIGIPRDKLDEVFEVFSQADVSSEEAHSGLGIGLSVVRGLVELHGGTAVARSLGKGQGTEIVLRLPLARQLPPVAAAERQEHPPLAGPHEPAKEGKRVLVVDDNRDAVAMLQILLTMEGHEVRVAFDGEEAVREAESFHPDICLCDLGLPKMDGFEVARRLSLSLPDTTLISVSGWGQDEDRRRSKESGFADHLVKPVKIEDVIAFLA
jgi:signal transduction histidine kinase/CheY-like chemotaxis protein